MMHGPEKSDPGIVAMKPANKTEQSVAEPVERRAGTKGNVDQQSTCRTQSRISVSQALERIRKVQNALPSHTRGGSRMRESRTYGSVRGALSNERPYRVANAPRASLAAVHESVCPLTTGRVFSGRPSLTGHCGHGWTCSLPRPVAHDPTRTSTSGACCSREADFYPYQSTCMRRTMRPLACRLDPSTTHIS